MKLWLIVEVWYTKAEKERRFNFYTAAREEREKKLNFLMDFRWREFYRVTEKVYRVYAQSARAYCDRLMEFTVDSGLNCAAGRDEIILFLKGEEAFIAPVFNQACKLRWFYAY